MAKAGHGLVLGKFLPPHAGHQYLVQFAQNFVEKLTVLVCSLDREPIPGALRYAWMRELFPHTRVIHITDDLPQEPSEHSHFWTIWRDVVQRAAGEPLDFIFASENYGQRLATEVGAKFIPVDVSRSLVPISGTAIRSNPLANWQFIPPCVRPYFVRRVCLFGPESTGKSTLARDLAAEFKTVYVSEFARGLLDLKSGRCDLEDIPLIARGQAAAEDAMARHANRVLFCDTDLLLTTVWSEVLFGSCPDWIRAAAAARTYDLYLLLDVDVPWCDDSQRFLPHQRQAFFSRCRSVLERHCRPYLIVQGTWPQRIAQARNAVEELLQLP
jgi:HTH-type transcriptional regulator, transcriptional repressor of NAD biosynthesis genes